MKKNLTTCLLAGSLIMIGAGCSSVAVEKPSQTPVGEFRTITQKTVVWQDKVYQFTHRCQGEVKANDDGGIPYCIGKNQIAVIDPAFNINILASDSLTTAANAPILLDADLIRPRYPAKSNGVVLVSYAQEPCKTAGDCGVGGPVNFVRFAYNLSDRSIQQLVNFPEFGRAIWNPSGKKAVFYPNTCGGAGCNTSPLMGYDLSSDTVKTVTTDMAAGSDGDDQSLTDVNGTALPVWLNVTWKNESEFEVNVLSTDGSKKLVKGTF